MASTLRDIERWIDEQEKEKGLESDDEIRVYAVVGVYKGCVNSVSVHLEEAEAQADLVETQRELGIEPEAAGESDNAAAIHETELRI